jgi:hypothetical protein
MRFRPDYSEARVGGRNYRRSASPADMMGRITRFLPAKPRRHLHPTLIAAYGIPWEVTPGMLAIEPR